jgi:hypothetical protein
MSLGPTGKWDGRAYYALYAHCGRCDQIHGPLGSWPAECPTPGCGDASQMRRVDTPR